MLGFHPIAAAPIAATVGGTIVSLVFGSFTLTGFSLPAGSSEVPETGVFTLSGTIEGIPGGVTDWFTEPSLGDGWVPEDGL